MIVIHTIANKQSYLTASPRVLWLSAFRSLVWLRRLLPVYLPSEKLKQKPTKCHLTDNLSFPSLCCILFCLHFDSLSEAKRSFLGQWHILALIQTAAAKERNIRASIKSLMLCWSCCPLWGGGERERGRLKSSGDGEEAESVWRASVCSSVRMSM